MDLLERFWSKVDRTGEHWLWTRATNPAGYGVFELNRSETASGRPKTVLAHRLSWELDHGRPPTGIVRHQCDIPACVQPSCLIDGTQQENIDDMLAKGRGSTPPTFHGEACNLAVLTVDAVRAIRLRLTVDGETHRAIASDYGISRSTVSLIFQNKIWKTVL
jgi:hypothetical protein